MAEEIGRRDKNTGFGSPVPPAPGMRGAGGPPKGAGGPPPGIDAPPPGPDPISGALNVGGFAVGYREIVSAGVRPQLAIWFLDMRNFRAINPKYGFKQGNAVLQQVARGISEVLAADLPVARLGGDRFVFLTQGIGPDELGERVKELQRLVGERILNIGINHPVSVVAGVYYLRAEDYLSSHQRPMDYASIAHRRAHDDRTRSIVVLSDDDLERDTRRIMIEQSIDEALRDGQIEVWFQPQVDYVLGEVIGAEALARWRHPSLGLLQPKEFIPVLESCGKVHDLDLFVWEEACRCAGRWHSVADGNPVPISVNVSRMEMFEDGLMEHFLELKEKYDLPTGSLRLEITESAFVEETERLCKVVARMRSHDMIVEMDDFGSGLSSLNMLKDVPVDVVKLDMGFVSASSGEDRGGMVVGSVIRMLQGLDTPIIAEGVETLEQAEMLKNMGCRLMQGYHFSHPMPLAEFEGYVASNRTVERTHGREGRESNLEQLTSFDAASSYLFNNAIGGTLFFFGGLQGAETIMVNDWFLSECGLSRPMLEGSAFSLVDELADESWRTYERSLEEAHEFGSAVCHLKMRRGGRWILGCLRCLGSSLRGTIFNLMIIRSSSEDDHRDEIMGDMMNMAWNIEMLEKIVPCGFVKCVVDNALTINYISPQLVATSGVDEREFMRLFHRSLASVVVPRDRMELTEAIEESRSTGETVTCDVCIRQPYSTSSKRATMILRVQDERSEKTGTVIPWLYALIMIAGEGGDETDLAGDERRTITFDYDLGKDKMQLIVPNYDGSRRTIEYTGWLEHLETLPKNIAPESAAKILATVRDVCHHPISGFFDIKYAADEGDPLRWYHVNFVCVPDDDGDTQSVHGFAQDANDQMGSARWWRNQAERDSLTGLLNRSAVEQRINFSMRTSGAGAMFMIDLDGFKHVNDVLGHLAGDGLLRDVARVLTDTFREGEIIGRYGGDEFCAFVPLNRGVEVDVIDRRASEVIARISAIAVSGDIRVGASVGVAVSHSRAATFYDLLEAADDAMYESKSSGKGTYTMRTM